MLAARTESGPAEPILVDFPRARQLWSTALVAGLLIAVGVSRPGEATPGLEAYRPFTQPLQIPRTIELGAKPRTLRAGDDSQQMLPGARTPMWTFNGTFPGPTLSLQSGRVAKLRVVNDLPAEAGPLSIHLHGGHHPATEDGQPLDYLIRRHHERVYRYPMTSEGRGHHGAFLWYHDHHMDVTGRNIWRGLAGMAIVNDPADRKFGLPSGDFDIPLMIVDRRFEQDNSAPYPPGANTSPPNDAAVGDVILVNGVPQPYLDVAARRYRFRILNASNFTPYNLRLDDGSSMTQIAGGQGLLPAPVEREVINIGPAQRVEVVVDFSGQSGEKMTLESIARSQLDLGTGSPATEILQFRVGATAADPSRVPNKLRPLPDWVQEAPEVPDRTWAFGLGADARGIRWTINGRTFDPERVDAEVPRDAIETWLIVNTSQVTHLVHLHGVPFAILERNGAPPPAWEAGLEDTVTVDPGDRVAIAARFSDYLGRYTFHCHMLEHEDHGMMTQFEVVE